MDTLIKGSGLSESDIQELRKKFVSEYSQKMGWDSNNLTVEQWEKIRESKQYKSPGLILG